MAILTPEIKDFIRQHFTDDTDKLLLNARRYSPVDVPFAVDQIRARRQIKEKLPTWFANPDLLFPSRLSAEQCSSEITAHYKQSLVRGPRICDLTGGLGIDSWQLSQQAEELIYIERFAEYCRAAEHNFKTLGATNIQILEADVREIVSTLTADTFYIDPARRTECNRRVFALSDCEPDVLQFKNILLPKAGRLILKISPMADISETLRQLPETTEVHIIAVRNECKEVIFVLENTVTFSPRIRVVTINYTSDGQQQVFSFPWQKEKTSPFQAAEKIGDYLYEPNAAILKSGAFKLIATEYNISKLHLNSHLYTSGQKIGNFPGRIFKVANVHEFSGKKLKQLGKSIGQANITTRNFPLTVEAFRKSSGITEGGEVYLFATTLGNARKIIIECRKI